MKLEEKDLKDLNAFIQEMPTKYGLPLLQFFQKIENSQKKDEVQEGHNTNS